MVWSTAIAVAVRDRAGSRHDRMCGGLLDKNVDCLLRSSGNHFVMFSGELRGSRLMLNTLQIWITTSPRTVDPLQNIS